MLRVLQTCSVGTLQSFQFLKDYLLQLARSSSCEWKRRLFTLFVDSYCRPEGQGYADKATQARIILYLIIPSFYYAFEQDEKEKLMGGPPNPDLTLSTMAIGEMIEKIEKMCGIFESRDLPLPYCLSPPQNLTLPTSS